jgi:hypothetical protein
MSQSLSIALNLKQNSVDFKLEPIENQPPLFKYKFISKVLDPLSDNPEDLRTVTIRCLFTGCK